MSHVLSRVAGSKPLRKICVACVLGYFGSAAGEAVMASAADEGAVALVEAARIAGQPNTESSAPPIGAPEPEAKPAKPIGDDALLDIALVSDCKAMKTCIVEVRARGRDGWHSNDKAPWKIVFDKGTPVIESSSLPHKSFFENATGGTTAVLRFEIFAREKGSVHVKGKLKAFVCDEAAQMCKGPIAHDLDVNVPVGAS